MTFPIDEVYLDGRAMAGSTWGFEDDAGELESDSGVIEAHPRFPRPRRSWLLSYQITASVNAVEDMFNLRGNHRGFLFVPKRKRDYICTDQLIGIGDGSTTTFRFRSTLSDGVSSLIIPVLRILGPSQAPVGTTAPAPTFTLDDEPFLTGFTINYDSPASVTFDDAPEEDVEIRSTFWRAWAAKIKSTKMDTTEFNEFHRELRSIGVEEVFEDET